MPSDSDVRLTSAFSIVLLLVGAVFIWLMFAESSRLGKAVRVEDESLQMLVEQHSDLKARKEQMRKSAEGDSELNPSPGEATLKTAK